MSKNSRRSKYVTWLILIRQEMCWKYFSIPPTSQKIFLDISNNLIFLDQVKDPSNLSLAAVAACYGHCFAFSRQKQFPEFFSMGCFHWGLFVVRSGWEKEGEKVPTLILSSFNLQCLRYHPAFYPRVWTHVKAVSQEQNVYQICKSRGAERGRCFRVFRSEILANCGHSGESESSPIPRSHWSYPSDTWHFLSKLPNFRPFKLSLWHPEDILWLFHHSNENKDEQTGCTSIEICGTYISLA